MGLGLAALFVVIAASFLLLARQWNPSLSQDDLCPVDREPIGEIVIVFDATDPWNIVQRAVIAREFQEIQRQVPRFAQLSLFTVQSNQVFTRPALRLCNPGRPSDFERFPGLGLWGVHLVANPKEMKARWDSAFIETLEALRLSQDTARAQPRSPIMETIRNAAITTFENDTTRKSLYIFSDMLQNTERYSHYREPSWTSDEAMELADVANMGTRYLDDVDIYVYLLDRGIFANDGGNGRSTLIEFWDAYFLRQDAVIREVRRIEG